MTGLNHGMTGAVIALIVKNPVLAVPLAFTSHFLQDIIPHWDYGIKRNLDKKPDFFTKRFSYSLLVDFLISIAIMIALAILFPAHKWLIWACMIAAASPDLMWAYYRLYREYIQKQKPQYNRLTQIHTKIQWSQTALGGLVEAVWFLLMGGIILSLR